METSPPDTFRGLPLTREQDSEIRHFIHCRKRSGLPWDTPELEAMLADMLDPPEVDEEGAESVSDCMRVERAAAVQDGGKDEDAPLPPLGI
jgi:hypothetical protein